MARSALRANPLRSALTMLGIIIGILTVTLMGAFIVGLNDMFHETTSFMGTDVYYIDKFSWGGDTWMKDRNRPDVTQENAAELRRRMMTARAVSTTASEWSVNIKSRDAEVEQMRATGVDAEYQTTASVNLELGRFFATQELLSARPVCVIGYDIWDQLFHKANPLGQQIRVNGYPLEIVGVAKQVGGMFGVFSIDHEVMMTLRTFLNAFGDPHRSFTIAVKAKSVVSKEDTKAEAAYQMRIVRGLKPTEEDDFAINSQDQFNKAFDSLTVTLNMIGFVITGLSLIVGGIGIMNIMFVSVKERTREIGIRKAIGARRRMILSQFLSEATMLCLLAGLIGLGIAYAIALVLNGTVLSDSSVKVVFSASIVVTALGLSLIIGLMSGLLPAWRASRLDPVDALRYE